MDTGEKYIEICEKAEETQELRNKPSHYGQSIIYDGDNVYAELGAGTTNLRWVWLPRQDQLQKMVKRDTWSQPLLDLYSFLNQGTNSVKRILGDGADKSWIRSMEQLWLAFVMYEKYKKEWDGKEWIKKEA